MKRQHPLFSPIGCGLALLAVIFLIVSVLVAGGALFSPGPVSASAPRGRPLAGYTSHADFENACEECHAPWQGASDVRCLDCHTEVQAEVSAGTGMHGVMPPGQACADCHFEHQGRDSSSTQFARRHFDHDWTGFTLINHRLDYDGSGLACESCHGTDYSFTVDTCARCHSAADPVFLSQHVNEVGADCVACHRGAGAEAFDHSFFPLKGGHDGLTCTDCHGDQTFAGTPTACFACHTEPEIHRGQFGTDCAACHSIDNWREVRLVEHVFPLDHAQEGGQTIACAVCHPTNYVTYTCYSSGCHGEADIREKHVEEGIVPFDDCMDCHPTGHEEEREGRESSEDD